MSALYIANLHPGITELMLYDKFSTVGPVRLVNIGRDLETHQRLGYAYVYFHKAEHAKRAFKEMRLDVLHGRPLDIILSGEVSQPPPVDRSTTPKEVDERQKSETTSESSDGQSESTNDGDDNHKDGHGRRFDLDVTCHENNNRPRSASKRSSISASSEPSSVTNLYIGNFSREFDEDGLRDLFRVHGKIVSCKISKYENGQSKGQGFCSFRTADAAEKAIEALNGYVLNGRKLYVGPFISRHERQGRSQGTRGTNSNQFDFNLYINNLDESVTNVTLEQEFSKFGHVLSSTVMLNAAGQSQGFGFVAFETKDEMDTAMKEMDGAKLGKKRIDITVAWKR